MSLLKQLIFNNRSKMLEVHSNPCFFAWSPKCFPCIRTLFQEDVSYVNENHVLIFDFLLVMCCCLYNKLKTESQINESIFRNSGFYIGSAKLLGRSTAVPLKEC